MIIALIVAAVAAYVATGTATARFAYGRLRAQAIKEYGLKWIDDDDASIIVISGTLASFVIWPVALIGFAIFGNPPKTNEELEEENQRQAKYIEQLEKATGIGGHR